MKKFNLKMVIITLLTLIIGGVALASIPSANGTISACYSTITGNLRAINTDTGATCGPFENPLVLSSASSGGVRTIHMILASPVVGNGQGVGNPISFSLTPSSFTIAPNETAFVSGWGIIDATACAGTLNMSQTEAVAFFQNGGYYAGGSPVSAPTGSLYPVGAGSSPFLLVPIGTNTITPGPNFFADSCGNGATTTLTQFNVLVTIYH